MHRYRAFSMTIDSDVRLDELTSESDVSRPADLRIVRTDIGYPIPPLGNPADFDYEDPAGTLMMWPGAAAIRIKGPDLIEIQPYADVPEAYLAFPLLGPIMGWVLHMRGLFVLHASAVVRNGRAFAFLGDKGAGKSTTATAFLKAGSELLTDDLLAIDVPDGQVPQMLPAFAQFKLTTGEPGAEGLTGAMPLPLVMEGFGKRQYRLATMHRDPIACGSLFVLERGGREPKLEWLGATDGLAALIRNSYTIRFARAPVEQQARGRQFRQIAALLGHSRVGKLMIPHDVERLPETVALLDKTPVPGGS